MKKIIWAILIAFLYSLVCVVVGPMVETQNFSINKTQIIPFLLSSALYTVVNIVLFTVAPKLKFDWKSERIKCWLDKVGEGKFFIIVWAFIFVSWIPAYLVMYPGVLSYDIIGQTASAWGKITNNHHPILHTWLIRVFMDLGDKLFSSYEHGIGMLSLMQMMILSYALTRLVLLLKKKRVPIWIVLGTGVLSAIWFMNACLAVTMIKDTLHAAFLILFVCHFAEIVTNPSEYISKKKNLILLPLVGFFMCATRNNGFHIYVFCFVILMLLRIAQIKSVKKYVVLVLVILLPVIMFKVYSGPVFEAMGIEQGEVREALSVPIQQLQRVAISKAGELTYEQSDLMNCYITDLSWREWEPGRKYDPFFADPAKSCFVSALYNDDPLQFWKFYLELGLEFPKEYVAAFLSNTLGFWYPGYYEHSYVMYENYPSDYFVKPLVRQSLVDSPFLEKTYESLCGSPFWRSTPGLRLFFVSGFAPWMLVYALVFAWRKKGFFTKVLPIFLPVIAQFGIMILSPMSSFRYSWPFYLILPIVFIGIFNNMELEEENEKISLEG